ncbi:MAG TPA: alternative ribosome rescue aminoacyl-tRNA hydrolase ArfB [Bacteroidales bacterium]|jgi:ribosome-associated protein|nr:alternative ribosome rescue aminoacyl-tRNA hydrolase ArfB [Bacteroidales bacterium]
MKNDILAGRNFENELRFSASRSSGPGGQNVNKVSTRVELRFDVGASMWLNDNEKALVFARLASKISKEGMLIIVSQSERSQYANREKAIERFHAAIRKAITPVRKRILSKPTAASKLKRLEKKKIISRKKELRKPVDE